MQEIINAVIKAPIETLTLKEISQEGSNRIYLVERCNRQSVLVKRNNEYFWRSFYLDQENRTSYKTFNGAIESRFEKKQRVFILRNKTELKEMIKGGGGFNY